MSGGAVPAGFPVPTVRWALSADGQDLGSTVAASLSSARAGGTLPEALRGLTGPLLGLALPELGTAVAGLAEIDLRTVLLDGWRIHRKLVAAAQRTAGSPEAEEPVVLKTHEVSAAHRPTVDLLVDERPVATIHVEIRAVLTLESLVALVKGGRLVTVGPGGCEATVSLALEGIQVASRTRRLELSGGFPLGSGIQIVSASAGR